ncbi:MAG: hypothetical protein GXY50_09455 [Syntrophomonadaceae bacterium]|nr:hypothetical protein [Syntrophomonadaceae bacterium]
MIVGKLKEPAEIRAMIKGYDKVLVLGCDGCVTICQTGGAQEARVLARLLALDESGGSFSCQTVSRQCEWEFLKEIKDQVEQSQIVVSTACGIGVQAMNEYFPAIATVPALDTEFLGMPVEHGVFEERCQACGDCMLHLTGGICPVARCAKSLMNGPCGGSQDGKCEISPNILCAWQLIYDRLTQLGQLDRLLGIQEPKDWSLSRDGGLRRMAREDLILDDEE